MRGAKFAVMILSGIAVLGTSLAIASAKPRHSPPKASKPATSEPQDLSGWSGKSGASGNPLMTTDAIRASAANFNKCVESQWSEARRRGVTRANFAMYTETLKPDLQIMDLLDNQAEFTKPVWDYFDGVVTEDRVARGRALLAEHRDVFDAVEKAYGVDRNIIAAIWGAETNYGQTKDDRSVVRSTATLACVGRRQGYYREEFVTVLEILQHGDIAVDRLTGNWAGAFGGTQFMPTSFRRFAVDFDKDGKRDLIGSLPDLLASTANFLKFSGWTSERPWSFEVRLPENFNYLLSNGPRRSIRTWGNLGVTLADGKPLPQDTDIAYLILPAGAAGPAFLALTNYSVLLSYNPAESYAVTVASLADRLRGQGPLLKSWPRNERMLTVVERLELQGRLQQRGFSVGKEPTGRIDPPTRRAIQKFQVVSGLAPDGFASAAVLDRLRMR